jgi:hypothetical protein
MADIGSLVASMQLNDAHFQKGIKQVNGSLGRIEKTIGTVSKALGAMFGVAVLGGITGFVGQSVKMQENLGRLRDRLGVSTEALSAMKFQAESNGVAFKTFTMGLQRSIRRIGEASQVTNATTKALHALGLSAAELIKLSPEQQFLKLADALKAVENSSIRATLAQKIFDSEGVALLQTMQNGAQGFRDAAQEAQNFGAIITNDMANAAIEASGRMDRFQLSLTGMSAQITSSLMPTLGALADFFATLLPGAIRIGSAAINLMRSAVSGTVALVLNAVSSFNQVISDVLTSKVGKFLRLDGFAPSQDAIFAMQRAAKINEELAVIYANVAIEATEATIVTDAFSKGTAGAVQPVEDLADKAKGAAAALKAMEKATDEADKSLREARDAVDGWKSGLDDLVTASLPVGIRLTEEYAENLERLQDALRNATPEGVDRINAAIKNVNDEFVRDMANINKKVEEELPRAFENAAKSIQGTFKDVFVDIFSGVGNGFQGLLDSLKSGFINVLADMAALAASRATLGALFGDSLSGGQLEKLTGGGDSVAGGLLSSIGQSAIGKGVSSIFSKIPGVGSLFGAPAGALPSAAVAAGVQTAGTAAAATAAAGTTTTAAFGASIAGGLATAGVGLAAGVLFSKLFGGKDESFPFAMETLSRQASGKFQTVHRNAQDGGPAGDIRGAALAISETIANIEKLGLPIVNELASIGVAGGRGALGSGFFAGTGKSGVEGIQQLGDFATPAAVQGLDTLEEAIGAAVALAFGATNTGELNVMIDAITREREAATAAAAAIDAAAVALDAAAAATAAAAAQRAQELTTFSQIFRDGAGLNPGTRDLGGLVASFIDRLPTEERVRRGSRNVAAGLAAVGTTRATLDDDIGTALAASDGARATALLVLSEQIVQLTGLEQTLADTRARALDDLRQAELNTLDMLRDKILDFIDTTGAGLDGLGDLADQLADRAQAMGKIGDLRLDLLGDSATSTLNAEQRIPFFQDIFENIGKLAATGDLAALEQLPGAARDLLDVSRQDRASVGLGEAGRDVLSVIDDVLAPLGATSLDAARFDAEAERLAMAIESAIGEDSAATVEQLREIAASVKDSATEGGFNTQTFAEMLDALNTISSQLKAANTGVLDATADPRAA